MDYCPRGHLTLWPRACPACRAQGIITGTWTEARREASDEEIRRKAREAARKAMEKVKKGNAC